MIANYLIGSAILYNPKKGDKKQPNYQAMANDKTQIGELRELITVELKGCAAHHWPHVCKMQETKEGLTKLQDMIIRAIAADGIEIGSAIALIEQDLAHVVKEDEPGL
jgi:hypothetical protein